MKSVVMNRWIRTPSARQTRAIGRAVGRQLAPGTLVLMRGAIGTGKTTLTKGIAVGLGLTVDISNVLSPTFVLVHEYPCRIPLYHIDLYRLISMGQDDRMLIDDYMERDGITVIEWAERYRGNLPQTYLLVELMHVKRDVRKIRFVPKGRFTWDK